MILDNLGLQYDASTASPGNIFKFTGDNNVILSGATVPTYYTIELAKSTSARLILLRNITISQSINFQTGPFDLNNNNVTLARTALLNNENETSRFIGANGGYINTSVNLHARFLPILAVWELLSVHHKIWD